jgi:hypothetical protein
MASNLQNVGSISKGLMMYGTDGAGGLASSTNQLVYELFRIVTCITYKPDGKFEIFLLRLPQKPVCLHVSCELN